MTTLASVASVEWEGVLLTLFAAPLVMAVLAVLRE